MFFVLLLVIAVVSVVLAFLSLKNERQRHEIDSAKEEMTHGRVIYHSSSGGESDSSL